MPRGVKNTTEEPQAEIHEETGVKPVVKSNTENRKIPVVSIPGKAVVATEYGHDFENVHFPKDLPLSVLSEAFKQRLGNPKNKNAILAAFVQPDGLITLYEGGLKRQLIRERNGVWSYGTETWPTPNVGPEVILRVIEDRLKSHAVKSKFPASEEGVYMYARQKLADTVKALLA